LASGLCKKNPEQTITVLFFDQVGSEIAQWIENAKEITSDQQLHQVLGMTYDPTQSPSIQLSALLKQVNNHTRLLLHGIIDSELEGYQNSQEISSFPLLTNLRTWQAKNNQPNLEIYTDWPELISDSVSMWNYQISGSFSQLGHKMLYPGHLEKLAKNEHESTETRKYVLYVKNPVKIDLSEFLLWIDLNHTTFVDQDWNFVLYRRDSCYNLKTISFGSTK
jgi:hypothetical protein